MTPHDTGPQARHERHRLADAAHRRQNRIATYLLSICVAIIIVVMVLALLHLVFVQP